MAAFTESCKQNKSPRIFILHGNSGISDEYYSNGSSLKFQTFSVRNRSWMWCY